MSSPADITIRRGTNKPDRAWRFQNKDGTVFDGTGSEFVLTISRGSKVLIRKDTSAGGGLSYDVDAGRLLWVRTLAESRLIPLGRVAQYEIERRIASNQSTILSGFVIGEGSISDD
ncbi:hypothetical protein [Methylobacterium sp. CM6257]